MLSTPLINFILLSLVIRSSQRVNYDYIQYLYVCLSRYASNYFLTYEHVRLRFSEWDGEKKVRRALIRKLSGVSCPNSTGWMLNGNGVCSRKLHEHQQAYWQFSSSYMTIIIMFWIWVHGYVWLYYAMRHLDRNPSTRRHAEMKCFT